MSTQVYLSTSPRKNCERLVTSSVAMVQLAFIRILLKKQMFQNYQVKHIFFLFCLVIHLLIEVIHVLIEKYL